LKVKAPARHVFIKIHQVWIVIYVFKVRYPFVVLAQQFGKRGFARANIASHCYMFRF